MLPLSLYIHIPRSVNDYTSALVLDPRTARGRAAHRLDVLRWWHVEFIRAGGDQAFPPEEE